MDKESYFINLFNNKFIGDDACVIDNYVYSQDAFFEDVHFKREWMRLDDIGEKAMLVNISDALAMNAKPLYALLTVSMPKNITPYEMEILSDGLKRAAERYGVKIVGGDTVSGPKLDISITIISESKNPIFRKGIKEGNLIAYTGKLGTVKKDLGRLQRGFKIPRSSKFIKPVLRDSFMKKAAKYMNAAMDISDGLFHDLEKLSRANRMGFEFFEKIPKAIGCSGEEFELLFAFDKKYLPVIMGISKKTRTPLTVFAKAARKSYKNRCRPHHF
ncbi:thiamine-phosphate kinase [Nitrosophilus alvini]|uniref:thiamine-phosphate kinase n=1 Tax=Nitrosophilus alvini TaxID=2714855 RepID=UPI00190BD9D6|nr:thiamine-phosphate kinase [Nitrosophilus alvini]